MTKVTHSEVIRKGPFAAACPKCGADPGYHDDAGLLLIERAHHYLLMCCRCGVDSVLDRWGRPA